MIKNSEDANKYYQLINQYIDEYTDNHKIRPAKLGKYLKNSEKLKNFLERKGLTDIKNIDRIISDVVGDRIAMEKDLVKTFESFKLFESEEFKILNLRQCLYKGIDKSNIHHEKILADYFDVSLSHIDIVDSDKHIFKIDTKNDINCVIWTSNEIEIIRENIKEYCFDQVFNKKVKLEGIGVDIDVNIKDFIDEEKFANHINSVITIDKVREIVKKLLTYDKVDFPNDNFIGMDSDY
jgi:hypothetical protein